jgi:hypothetical protein
MSPYTWSQQRDDIQRDVNQFFGRNIEITPRAMAAFQCGDNTEGVVVDYDNWDLIEAGEEHYIGVYSESVIESLLKSSPACSTILFKLGVKLEDFEFHPTSNDPAPLSDVALEWIFKGVDAIGKVPTVTKVRKKGFLEETDILISAVEASLRGRETNAIGWAILKSAGIKPHHRRDTHAYEWTYADEYLKQIVRGVKELAVADPSHALTQFVLYEDAQKIIHLRPFGVTGISRLTLSPPVESGLSYIYRGGVFQPLNTLHPEISDSVLGTFEELLNSDKASEADFQKYFEEYPFFLTGLDFDKAHPQPILYMDEGQRLIPDFFLESLNIGWDTILDLKRPYDDMVTRRPHRTYFKQHIQNAISQLRYYREWFDSPANRKRFEENYGIKTFRPRMVIVIGRKHHFRDDIERVRLLDGLPSRLDLWTYDDLYARAKRYLSFVQRGDISS